jgi:AcrR family transcriptional regulator
MPNQKKRGRPRSIKAEAAILKAARELLDEAGPARLTVEAVAVRAKVGKPTIYRYWANARELAMAALMQPAPGATPDTVQPTAMPGDFRARLTAHLHTLVDRFSTPRGRQTAIMLATAERDSEMAKAFRNQVIMKGREEGRTILACAIEDGEVSPQTSVETALDMIYGPIFFRLLTLHAPITQQVADEIVDTISAALCKSPVLEKDMS